MDELESGEESKIATHNSPVPYGVVLPSLSLKIVKRL